MTLRYSLQSFRPAAVGWIAAYADHTRRERQYAAEPADTLLVSLLPGNTLRVSRARLIVREGIAWATATGDPKDYVLNAGEQMLAKRDIVVQAIGDTSLQVGIAALRCGTSAHLKITRSGG